jgi:hypothetical protein
MSGGSRGEESKPASPDDAPDLRDYRSFVQAISMPSAGAAGELFVTRLPAHASVVAQYLFARAEFRVEIMTTCLNADVYGGHDVYLEAINFLDKSNRRREGRPGIFILYEDNFEISRHPLILNIRSRIGHPGISEGLEFRKVPPEVAASYSFHFMVADDRHFRFKQNRGDPEALVQFDEPNLGGQLHRNFEMIWREAGTKAGHQRP